MRKHGILTIVGLGLGLGLAAFLDPLTDAGRSATVAMGVVLVNAAGALIWRGGDKPARDGAPGARGDA